jgi:hypothetical protein
MKGEGLRRQSGGDPEIREASRVYAFGCPGTDVNVPGFGLWREVVVRSSPGAARFIQATGRDSTQRGPLPPMFFPAAVTPTSKYAGSTRSSKPTRRSASAKKKKKEFRAMLKEQMRRGYRDRKRRYEGGDLEDVFGHYDCDPETATKNPHHERPASVPPKRGQRWLRGNGHSNGKTSSLEPPAVGQQPEATC